MSAPQFADEYDPWYASLMSKAEQSGLMDYLEYQRYWPRKKAESYILKRRDGRLPTSANNITLTQGQHRQLLKMCRQRNMRLHDLLADLVSLKQPPGGLSARH